MLKTKLKTKSKKIDKELLFCIAMLAIPLVQFIIFYVIVNFNSFLMAFQKATFNYDYFVKSSVIREICPDLSE